MEWSKSKVEAMKTPDVEALRTNAQRLGRSDVVEICDEVLRGRPRTGTRRATSRAKKSHDRPLVSRKKALEMRGVHHEVIAPYEVFWRSLCPQHRG